MLRDAFYIALQDTRFMLRRKETLIWVFVMPILFFYMIGTITQGFGSSGPGEEWLALRPDANPGFVEEQLERRMADQGYSIARPEEAGEFERYSRRLIVPEGMTEAVLAGEQVKLVFEREGAGPSTLHDQFRVFRATYTLLADLIVATEQDGSISADSIERVNSAPRPLTLDVQPAGQRKIIPTGFTQAVPGTMVMFTLIVLLTSGSVLLVVERRDGLLRRLASTPISRSAVVWGKWGGRVVLGWTQLAFAMLVGKFLFKVDWGPHLGAVILLMAVYAGLIAWFAILLGTLARTEGQAVGMGVLGSNVLAALGGCWWPIEVTPSWMQQLANFLPTGWAMDALHKIVIFGNGPSTIIPHLLTMVVVAMVAAWISAKRFRYE
jgi:ABC-type Na+ efflux pump permease subunit